MTDSFFGIFFPKHWFPKHWTRRQYLCSTLIITTCAALLVLLLVDWAYARNAKQSTIQIADHYGESIASLTAEHAATTTFSNDPVSLQAIIQTVAQKTAVVSVAAYTLDNSIIAQINNAEPQDQKNLRHYTAPVTITNNITGSITIGIEPRQLMTTTSQQPLWAIGIVLLLIAFIGYFKGQFSTTNKATSSTNPTNDQRQTTVDPPTNTATKPNHHKAVLSLELTNINTLCQQLNADSRKQQLQQLQQYISDVLALYHGTIGAITPNAILLEFDSDNADSIFNALCSGYLILKLNEQNDKSMLLLNGLVQINNGDTSLTHTLHHTRQALLSPKQQHQLFIEPSLIEKYRLKPRVILNSPANPLLPVTITSFQNNYLSLLESQLQCLQKGA